MAQGMDEFVTQDGFDDPPVAYEAVVARSVTDVDDDLYVSPTELATDQPEGPCLGWQPHVRDDGDGVVLVFPSKGDRALLQRSDTNSPWVLGWTNG